MKTFETSLALMVFSISLFSVGFVLFCFFLRTGLGFDYFSLIMCVLSELYIFISLENQSAFILTVIRTMQWKAALVSIVSFV